MTERKRPNQTTLRSKIRLIWAISDGTIGMRFQALSLAEALSAAHHHHGCQYHEFTISPPPVLRHFPRLARHLPAASLDRMLSHHAPQMPLSDGFPDLVITCGRRMAGISMALRRIADTAFNNNFRTLHIQDPRLPAHFFDILILPLHDPTRGPNVITNLASLHRLTEEIITKEAATLDAKWKNLRTPRVAVLIGGDNKRYKISNVMITDMAQRLSAFAKANNASLALVTSRRTPPSFTDKLLQHLGNTQFVVADPGDSNPYPGIFAHVDFIIVTSDSVNMASEATVTGKPVLIAEWRQETGRIKAFHEAMIAAGHSAPMGEKLPLSGFRRLIEMPEIIARIDQLLASN